MGILIFVDTQRASVLYRNPKEESPAKEIADAREQLSELCSIFASRLLDFRTEQDVWIEIGKNRRLGLLREIGSGIRLALDEDGEKRNLSALELSELEPLIVHLPKLKKAVIAESFDHVHDIKSVVKRFREEVLDLAGDDE